MNGTGAPAARRRILRAVSDLRAAEQVFTHRILRGQVTLAAMESR